MRILAVIQGQGPWDSLAVCQLIVSSSASSIPTGYLLVLCLQTRYRPS
jgi:hypothetical protein